MTGKTQAPQLSKSEQEARDYIAAELAAGRDPYGDNDDDGATSTDQQAAAAGAATDDDEPAGDAGQGGKAPAEGQLTEEEAATAAAAAAAAADADPDGKGATELTAEQLAALANDEEPAVPAAPAPRYAVKAPEDADAKIAALEAKDAAAFKQLLEGEIDADAYAAVKTETGKEIRQIERAVARAETLAEANEQHAAAEQETAINLIKVQAKKAGLDYDSDVKAQRQFNAMVDAVASDPDNSSMTPAQIYAEANKAVYALRGLKHDASAPAPSPAPAAAPAAPRTAPAAPPTLRGLPAAAQSQGAGGIDDQLSRLSGAEFEAAYSKLSPAQKAALLSD